MPRYYRRSYRGRRYYRRRRPLMAMKVYQSPATSFRKMTYDCDKFISPGYNIGKVPNVHNIFRATSVYDPDYSIGGTSAVGYASAAEGFNHYTVMAARITTFWSPYSISASSYQMGTANEGAGIPIWAGVGLVADQSALTQDYTLLSKDHMWNWDSLILQPAAFVQGGTPGGKHYIQTKWFSSKHFFNSPDPRSDERLGSAMGTHPAENAFFSIACIAQRQCLFSATNSDFGTWSVHVHIDYWVALSEPKAQGVAP